MIPEPDFPSALQAARLGAEWAWTLIYRDQSPAVLRYLRAHGAREPEDLVGEVFVQVVRKIAAFDGGSRDFCAWVTTIARNRLIDEWRRERRTPVDPASDDVLAESSPTGDSEHEAMARFGDENVRAVVQRLSPDQRDVVFLRVLMGLTVSEVALVVGKTPGAVKSLQVRALAAIRREIARKGVSL